MAKCTVEETSATASSDHFPMAKCTIEEATVKVSSDH